MLHRTQGCGCIWPAVHGGNSSPGSVGPVALVQACPKATHAPTPPVC